MEMQRTAMRDCDGDKNCTEHMPVSDGKYDPHKLLQHDLEELKAEAFSHKAELIIGGDFNERFFQSQVNGKLHSWMENEMQLKNIHHNGTKVGNDTCFGSSNGKQWSSDIDWICASENIARTDMSWCWTHHYTCGGAHRPLFC